MPVTNVRSAWSSGNLVFYESGVGRSTTGDILTIATDGVTVGNTGNDIDFTVYSGSNTFKIDSGAGTMTFTGDVEITGDVDVSTEDIAVDQGKYIYLDGLSGSEHIRSASAGKITITASATGADDITLAGTVTAGDNITMTSGKYVYFRGTTEHIVSGSANNLTITAGTTVNVAAILSVSDTTEASAVGTASVTTAGGLGVTKKAYIGTDLVMVAGDIDMSTAGTGTYDIILKDSVADALSIRRASTDMIVFNSSTPSVTITPATTITGALTCSGAVSCDDTTETSSGTTGSIHTDGGLGIAKKLYVGTTGTFAGAIICDDTTDSSSTTTGSIQTDGGLGVAKSVYIGGRLDLSSGTLNVTDDAVSLINIGTYDTAFANTTQPSQNTFATTLNVSHATNAGSSMWLVGAYEKISAITNAQGNNSFVTHMVRMDIQQAVAAAYGIQSHVKFTAGTAQDVSAEVIAVSAQTYGACAAGTGYHWGVKSDLRATNTPSGAGHTSACFFGVGTVDISCGLYLESLASKTMYSGVYVHAAGNVTNVLETNGEANMTNFLKAAAAAGCIAANTHTIDGHALQHILTVDIAGDTGYIPVFGDVPA